jgi:hypothetical protein
LSSVVLTVVKDDLEAEELCGLLRVNGIPSTYRKSTVAYPMGRRWSAGISGIRGPTDVLVSEHDLERARELLAASVELPDEDPPVD